ncbi:bifunctional adenosylcobinamide kinase/adenosylcobinamide-phosphate guanylyltransferase [Rhodothalassium salexigens]|uniref:bifunctional adenosylcobinamide kinase/adenosylcobinamide-phosphate guanylyltransferase n=1 Tax=Rhodothalassium salexigens TaxID=1086 RepID=UPI00191407E7|nr:bifunctional adenosylcobinamide kinase/adenosylcobinamide-phosphate guanylyltransferase [Rhodothalassium salexigens]MBK5910714.1 bifunctional adenosylcobinamide kinase/adenosylcobinamide-phosphate guanylyltransferase [Rhodothalassium salexigens]MBK5921656.1 bifunctional adenosylcobinamide kinase/adenosylcobinamide-phosphate guanylyltransferase [Rhodothalassium salexigens]
MGNVVLVTGGARSGKSRLAEARLEALPPPWGYVATATVEADDAEMVERIRHHRDRRGAGWQTVEAPLDLVAGLDAAMAAGARGCLVDCLTLWLSNLLHAEADVDAAADGLCRWLAEAPVPVVLVTNEVGAGIVPLNARARAFRDQAGRLNQRVAAAADEVILAVAGLPLTVKVPAG